MEGKRILWSHFIDAYEFDQSCNSLPIHEKLTEQHLYLDPALRMRNHLPEVILDDKMLCLMKVSICVYENKKTNLSSMPFFNLILCSKGLYGRSTLPFYHFTSYFKCTKCSVHITNSRYTPIQKRLRRLPIVSWRA